MPGERVEKNIVFGMYSGLALLMDVYRPETPKGRGVLFVGGSGWESSLGWDAIGLKDKEVQLRGWLPALLFAGYTVFAVNHRAAPRFPYPAALEDVRRAIRFIRSRSGEFGIDPARIGAVAGSSGAHLACMAAMLARDSAEYPEGEGGTDGKADPLDRESSSLQCLVLREPPTDLWQMATRADEEGKAYAVAFIEGGSIHVPSAQGSYDAASPVTHIPPSPPPVLLVHGDADKTVPYAQSVAMEAALRGAGAEARLLTIPGGVHAPDFGAGEKLHPEWPDYLGEMVTWLDGHLS